EAGQRVLRQAGVPTWNNPTRNNWVRACLWRRAARKLRRGRNLDASGAGQGWRGRAGGSRSGSAENYREVVCRGRLAFERAIEHQGGHLVAPRVGVDVGTALEIRIALDVVQLQHGRL